MKVNKVFFKDKTSICKEVKYLMFPENVEEDDYYLDDGHHASVTMDFIEEHL